MTTQDNATSRQTAHLPRGRYRDHPDDEERYDEAHDLVLYDASGIDQYRGVFVCLDSVRNMWTDCNSGYSDDDDDWDDDEDDHRDAVAPNGHYFTWDFASRICGSSGHDMETYRLYCVPVLLEVVQAMGHATLTEEEIVAGVVRINADDTSVFVHSKLAPFRHLMEMECMTDSLCAFDMYRHGRVNGLNPMQAWTLSALFPRGLSSYGDRVTKRLRNGTLLSAGGVGEHSNFDGIVQRIFSERFGPVGDERHRMKWVRNVLLSDQRTQCLLTGHKIVESFYHDATPVSNPFLLRLNQKYCEEMRADFWSNVRGVAPSRYGSLNATPAGARAVAKELAKRRESIIYDALSYIQRNRITQA